MKNWARLTEGILKKMNWDTERFKAFRNVMANIYPMIADSMMMASDAGLPVRSIAFQTRPDTNWHNILTSAQHNGLLDKLLNEAIAANPNNETLKELRSDNLPTFPEGPAQLDWRGTQSGSALEKIIGSRSTLVPISYLALGLQRAKSVVKVKRSDGSSGSGFLVEGNMLLTNHHVLPSAEIARTCVVQFNYEQTHDGLDAQATEACFDPTDFSTSASDDWTLAKLKGDPQATWGSLTIAERDVEVGEYVNIIGHPGGGQKQVSLSANVVVYANESRVQYLTDTLPGSSGSPVFDAKWNVVAMHHSGGWLEEPNAKRKTTYFRNEGISAKVIRAALTSKSVA